MSPIQTVEPVFGSDFDGRRNHWFVYTEPPEDSILKPILQDDFSHAGTLVGMKPSEKRRIATGFFPLMLAETEIIFGEHVSAPAVTGYAAAKEPLVTLPARPTQNFYLNAAGREMLVKQLLAKLCKRGGQMILQRIDDGMHAIFDGRKGERYVIVLVGMDPLDGAPASA